MECVECEDAGGDMAEIEFKDGTVTNVPLCEECREESAKGNLVQAVNVEGG